MQCPIWKKIISIGIIMYPHWFTDSVKEVNKTKLLILWQFKAQILKDMQVIIKY
jgi:hypothetical protein